MAVAFPSHFIKGYDALYNKTSYCETYAGLFIFETIEELGNLSFFTSRVCAPIFIATLGIIHLVGTVTRLAESIIAAVGNILGSAFSNRCSFKNGLKILFFIPIHLITNPISIVVGLAFFTIASLFSPCKAGSAGAYIYSATLEAVDNHAREQARLNALEGAPAPQLQPV